MEPSSKRINNDCSTLVDEAGIHEEYVQTSETLIGETSNANISQSFEDLEPKHKVFLSHSGVQKDFVEQLCIDLETCDRYPFFDKRRGSLPIGVKFPELIFDAIKQCQVGVFVFSEDFFMKTKWPMLELVAMVRELKRNEPNSSIKIIPVFFKLSRQEWLDERNHSIWLSQWEKWAHEDDRIDIEEWKMALCALKSINSLKMDHGEVHLRKEIVKAVCELVLPEVRLYVSHVQGRSRLCKILIEKLNETKQQDGKQVMGLYGVGGIGKTTICKAMCNELFQKFNGKVCHIELNSANEVEVLQALLKRFTTIQHKILKELNIDQCRDQLKRCIVKDPIFLALDNLTDSQAAQKQAKIVLGTPWGRGSIVMVVARGLGELNYFVRKEDCLEMPNLMEDEARSLFLDHVEFGPHSTAEIDEGLVWRCVERCHFSKGKGLGHHYIPLALEVLGELLGSFGYDPEQWEERLQKVDAFGQVSTREEHRIFSVLRASYSSLSDEAQMLFMDVALFLPSHHFHPGAKYKWNLFDWLRVVHGSRVDAMTEILASLKKRSLLADLGDGRTKVVMHDLWREFCVAEAAIANFEERRWLFLEEESSKLAECSPGPGSCWRKMRRMCFLNMGWRALNGVQLDDFVNLSVLKVESGSFTPPGSSLELDLKGLKHLKSLELRTNASINIKCLGLGTLVDLAYLRWGNFRTPLPDITDIGRLSKLEVLDVEGFQGEKLPDLSVLTSLRLVLFTHCPGVTTITGLSAKMTNIEFVGLPGCSRLQECPGLGALCALEYLELRLCRELKEVPCLRLLTRLRVLSIDHCPLLRAIPGLNDLVALEELSATGCVNLELLPDLQRLSKLRILECGSCMALKSFTCTGPLLALEGIDFSSCNSLEEIPNLSNFPKLKFLDLSGCKLQECPGLDALCSLEHLHLGQCHELKEVPCLRLLTRLMCLCIGGCQLLRAVPGLSDLIALEELWATGCVNLEVLPDLQRLSKLRKLKCVSCMALKSFTCTGPLLVLESIDLRSCSSLEEIPDLSNFPQLKVLELCGCTSLTRLTNSAPLRALLVLCLTGCSKVSALPHHLSSSLDLRELRLGGSGISLDGSKIRELQASCPPHVVFPSFDEYDIVESGSSTAVDVADGETELQINMRNGFRWRRLPGSVLGEKVMKLTYTKSGGSLLALMSNGAHKLWKWEHKLNDPKYQDIISSPPQLLLPTIGVQMTNVINEAFLKEVMPSVMFCFKDKNILSTSGGSVSLYDIYTFKRNQTIMHPPPTPTSLAIYPYDEKIMLIGMEDSSIQILNVSQNLVVCTLKGHQKRVTSLAFSKATAKSTCVLASLGADDQLCVWIPEAWGKRQSQSKVLEPAQRVACVGDIRVQFHNDQRDVLVVGKLQLAVYDTLNLDHPKAQWIPESPFTATISDASYSCNGQYIFVGFADGSIGVLLEDFQFLFQFHTPRGLSSSPAYPLSIAAHPHNPIQFALGMSDGGVIVVEPLASEASGSTAAVFQEEPGIHDAPGLARRCGCFDYIYSCLFSTSSLEGDSTSGTDFDEAEGVECHEQSSHQSR